MQPNLVRVICRVTLTLLWTCLIGYVNGSNSNGRLALRNLNHANGTRDNNNEMSPPTSHRLKPPPSATLSCFNLSVVQKTVFNSDNVFAGKIMELKEKPFVPPITVVDEPEKKIDSTYYWYNYSKKRRRAETTTAKPKSKLPQYVANVLVKTVFKGPTSLEGQSIEITINPPSMKISSDSVMMQPRCLRRLRALDTRIFFYTQDSTSGLQKKSQQQQRHRDFSDDDDDRKKTEWNQMLIPLPPTLRILDIVRTAVKDNPHGSALNYGGGASDEPCEATTCTYGASCYVENGRALCRCPDNCPSHHDPVCGSDDLTYTNECLLRMIACQNHNYVRVRHGGECDKPDPCAKKRCHFGAKCIPTLDGLYAICECPTSCPDNVLYGRKEDSEPVCGSDGKLYRNRCELDKEACRLRRNITVKYYGKCDPCEDVLCTPPQVCHLDEDRRPICRCGEMCTSEFEQVCASDGKTYSNECVMRQEACRTRQDLRIIYRGKCSSGVNPCESRKCRGYETCGINRFGIAQCTCAMKCDPVIQPVCGSDGKTYDNYCQLTFAACRDAKHMVMSYRGTCDAASACARHSCPPEATCVEKNGQVTCECPECPSDYDPVCGSDGISYQNECRLRMEACLTNNNIRKVYEGLCNGCDHMQCDFYSVCDGTSGAAKCVCPQSCGASNGIVCGTDGMTYESECELQKSACEQQKFVVVASNGACDLCANVQCKFGAECSNGSCVCPVECPLVNEPVCGSDLKSYRSECEVQKAACQLARPLSVLFYGHCTDGLYNVPTAFGPAMVSSGLDPASSSSSGRTPMKSESDSLSSSLSSSSSSSSSSLNPDNHSGACGSLQCEFGAICELSKDGFSRCTCQFNCTAYYTPIISPVCGSDLRLYSNECEMGREGCQRQIELRPRPLELCEDETTGRTTGGIPPCLGRIHGCCPDGVTAASGPNQSGCPPLSASAAAAGLCQCNKLGSVSEECDLVTQECHCRRGVGGPKCDRCLPGFWGLTQLHQDGHKGCKECGCSRFGSIREDCEQMSGKCVCKSGVQGHKCDSCDQGEYLGPYGCTRDAINLGRSCEEVACDFGAECAQDGSRAGCICNLQCANGDENEAVCASDGFTYESECLMKRQACRNQKPLYAIHNGPCPSTSERSRLSTESSGVGRWTTGLQYTEPGDDGTDGGFNGELWEDKRGPFPAPPPAFPGMKSTRHLPSPQEHSAKQSSSEFHRNVYRASTSATLQMRSYLGDGCQWTADCVTAQSICHGGFCVCREGFYEDSERIQCKPIHSHLSGLLSCSKSHPLCTPPASCFDYRNGTYACVCPLGKSDPNDACQETEQLLPFFNGRSSMEIDKLAGYHKLSLELEITPYMDHQHGILIFSSQHGNGSGDFLSLALVDGYVELRYDLGDGPAILRSASRLSSGSLHSIVAKRYNRDGLLRLDDEEDVKGTSPGTMKSLNLDQGGYMGWVPLNSTKVWEIVGTSEGFVGCVHKLRVGRRPVDFVTSDPLIQSLSKVWQCPALSRSNQPSTTPMYSIYEAAEEEVQGLDNNQITSVIFTPNLDRQREAVGYSGKTNPCLSRNPCQNHGICWHDVSNYQGYKCACHPEFSGDHCETKSLKVEESEAMLDFRGFSYLELKRIENPSRKISIELWLMVRAKNGIILYEGQEMGKGDFITLLLTNGHVQFLFDLGSGMANITWNEAISLNKWHWIVATRDGREGTLQIDGQPPISAKSPPTLSELNLELPLYIGGIRDMNLIHRELGLLVPFDGVLQYLKVNGETYHKEIVGALRQRLVHRYEGPPCGSSVSPPCGNGGSCFPRLDSFHCLCSAQFTGRTCERRKETPGPVRFDGQHFIKFPRKISKQESFSNVSINYEEYEDESDVNLDVLFGASSPSASLADYDSDDDEEGDRDEYFAGEEFYQYTDDHFDFEDDFSEFNPWIDDDDESFIERTKAQRRNRIEIVFRTTSHDAGLILWTGKGSNRQQKPQQQEQHSRKGYLGLFLAHGHVELRVDLGAGKNKKPTVVRSKVKVNDGRWHKVLIARQRRLLVLQVDGAIPQRATAPAGSNTLISDGRYWIGGVAPSILPAQIPPAHHQGFLGCVDLVRIEKRRLPLFKIAYSTGIPLCEDDDD